MVSNLGFADGNKRTALHLVVLLIERSDYVLRAEDTILADAIVGVANGTMSYEDLVEWFRSRLSRP